MRRSNGPLDERNSTVCERNLPTIPLLPHIGPQCGIGRYLRCRASRLQQLMSGDYESMQLHV